MLPLKKTFAVPRRHLLICIGLTLFIFLFSLLFLSCGLFPPADSAYLDKLREEIAWSNAEKISVTVAFPNTWGTSTQAGVDRCINHKGVQGDIRVGYPFNVEFFPGPEYALLEWRAYRTSDLPANWVNNAAEFMDRKPQLEGWTPVPAADEGGEIVSFTLTAKEDITIVPYARAQPRIVSIIPEKDAAYYHHQNEIVIQFAADMDTGTFKFPESEIETFEYIFLDGTNLDDNSRIANRAIDYFTIVTVNSRTLVLRPKAFNAAYYPTNHALSLFLGTQIATANGNTWEFPVEYTWKTPALSIENWTAAYEDGKILLGWVGSDNFRVNIRREKNGVALPPILNVSENSCVIDAVPSYTVEQLHRYDLWIDIIPEDGDVIEMDYANMISIWNIPDLSSSMVRPAIGIRNASEFMRISYNLHYIYVLENDIEIRSRWSSLGDRATPFSGIFYGAGNNIIFPGTASGYQSEYYAGLFGYIRNAIIQDLSIVFTGNSLDATVTGSSLAAYFGGLAAYAESSVVKNVTVQGQNAVLKPNRSGYAGGFVGEAIDSIFTHCGSELSILAHNGASNAGGFMGAGSYNTVIEDCWAQGAVTVIDTASSGTIHIGGFIGSTESGVKIENCTAAGAVHITGDTAIMHAGGFIGRTYSSLKNSSATGNVTANVKSTLYAGGLAGSTVDVTECYATGNVEVTSVGDMYAGGLTGFVSEDNTITKSYAAGNVTVTGSRAIRAGGLVGYGGLPWNVSTGQITSSWAKGNVTATRDAYDPNSNVRAGGLVGEGGIPITNCYALGDVEAHYEETRYLYIYAGGLVGDNAGRNIVYCFTGGSVRIKSNVNSGEIFAGGIEGHNRSVGGTTGLKNTVALGNWVSATSTHGYIGGTVEAFRISLSVNNMLDNNYALSSMLVGTSNGGYNAEPTLAMVTSDDDQYGADKWHGANIDLNAIDRDFWETTVGFSSEYWDFSGMNAARPYPVLKGVGGQ